MIPDPDLCKTFLVPRDWSKTQSYKRASPQWFKFYTGRIFDDAYRKLTPAQRSALHGLEMLYAVSGSPVPLEVEMLNRKLELKTKMSTWLSLSDAGFVELIFEDLSF